MVALLGLISTGQAALMALVSVVTYFAVYDETSIERTPRSILDVHSHAHADPDMAVIGNSNAGSNILVRRQLQQPTQGAFGIRTPNKASVWFKGTQAEIRWQKSPGSIGQLQIDLLRNSFFYKNVIFDLPQDTRSLSWKLPNDIPIDNQDFWQIRISGTFPNRTQASEVSEPFVIGGINVSPLSNIVAGSVYDISFASYAYRNLTLLNLDLYENSTQTPLYRIASGISHTSRSYSFYVPYTLPASSKYYVVLSATTVSGVENTGSTSGQVVSGETPFFTVQRPSIVNKPGYGFQVPTDTSILFVGSAATAEFRWPLTDDSLNWRVDLYSLSSVNPYFYGTNLTSSQRSKSLKFTVSAAYEPGKYFLRVWGWGPNKGSPDSPISFLSPVFIISNKEADGAFDPLIRIRKPNAVTSWLKNSTNTIIYELKNAALTSLRIDLFLNSETYKTCDFKDKDTFVANIAKGLSPFVGEYNWTIPINLDSSADYVIGVSGEYLDVAREGSNRLAGCSGWFVIKRKGENIRPRGYQNMDSASTKTTQVETSMWTWIFSAYSLLYGYVTAF